MRRFGWLASMVALLMGCQSILGISDLETTGQAGAGGTGGEGGSSTGGEGGEGGEGGDAGSCDIGEGAESCAEGMGMCPGMCTAADECVVDCDDNGNDCTDLLGNIACGPPDMYTPDCHINCRDDQCATAGQILCPEGDSECIVRCHEPGSCDGATIRCGSGPCNVECTPDSCVGTTVICGPKACNVMCSNGSVTIMDPQGSCSLQPSMGCGQPM